MLRCLRNRTNRLFAGQTHRAYAAGWKSLQWKHGAEMQTFYPILLVKRPTIRIRKVRPRDVPNVIRLMRKQFANNEPLVNALQMEPERYSPVLEEMWRNSIDYGMSFLAVPSKIGNTNIFGAVINTKVCPWDPDQMVKLSSCVLCSKTRDLLNLWAHFFKDSEIFSKFNNAKIFNISNVILNEKKSKEYHSDLTAHKLASLLVNKSIRFAHNNGFNLACLVCTGNFLSRVANNIGMELFWKYPYKNLLNEKLDPLLKIQKPNTQVKIFIQELNKPDNKKLNKIHK